MTSCTSSVRINWANHMPAACPYGSIDSFGSSGISCNQSRVAFLRSFAASEVLELPKLSGMATNFRRELYMRIGLFLRFFALLTAAACLIFGQGGNGIITGIVADPTGAVVAGALVAAKNTETGVVYSGATTNAGVYTIADAPVGVYSVSTAVQGF